MGLGSEEGGRLCAALLGWLESRERGETFDVDALAAENPAVGAELREFVETYARVERLAAPLRGRVQGSRRREPWTLPA